VGANNRMTGRATRIDGNVVTLTSAQGLEVRALAAGGLRPGDAVEAFVRPEVASISRHVATFSDAGLPSFRGTVDSILFDGANSTVLLREESCRCEFRIALPQTGQLSGLAAGETVHFGFDPQRAVCFAATSQAEAHAV
jgi:spermidine/putrescine transport system ATP-binding protein